MARFKCSVVYAGIFAVIWMWFTAPFVAQANYWDLLAWPRNTKLAVEISWGLPYGKLLSSDGEVDGISLNSDGETDGISALPFRWSARLQSSGVRFNQRWGIVGWYGFIKDQENGSFALGPEVGLFLGNKYQIEFTELGNYDQVLGSHAVEAHAVHMPICLQGTFFSEKFSKILELRVGYELSFIYALYYQWSPGELLQPYTEKQGTWKADRTAISGSLMVGGTVYYLKGCYLGILLKSPLEALIKLNRSHERDRVDQNRLSAVHLRFFHGAWALHSSLVECSLGIDLIALFLEDF